MTDYPNDQGNPAAAIPVKIALAAPSGPPYPNDQGDAAGALPVKIAPPPAE